MNSTFRVSASYFFKDREKTGSETIEEQRQIKRCRDDRERGGERRLGREVGEYNSS